MIAVAAQSSRAALRSAVPGLLVSATLAAAAFFVSRLAIPANPLMWALVLGVLAGRPLRRLVSRTEAGYQFASRALLRAGVALLGLGISVGELASVGPAGLAIAGVTLALTLWFTVWAGRMLRIKSDLAVLIATGTAVCGASAIVAMSAGIRASREAASYAIASVTLLGSATMLLLPLAGELLALDARQTGIWAGASIHEVSQVTVAGAAVSTFALETATLVKLARVAMLAPVLMIGRRLANGAARDGTPKVAALPGFVAAFLALIAVRSLLPVPDDVLGAVADVSKALQAVALAAIGLQVEVGQLRTRGFRPLALGLLATATATAVALGGVLTLT